MSRAQLARLVTISLSCLLCLASGCDDGTSTEPDAQQCPDGQIFNEGLGRCLAVASDAPDSFFDDVDLAEDTASPDTTTTPDTTTATTGDMTTETDGMINPACDQDNDGELSLMCGGRDCDDTQFAVSPERREVCDGLDNNCNNEMNEGLDCTFYVHTDTELLRIDPFTFDEIPIVEIPDLFDIDTHPNGTLYGVAADRLYSFNSGQVVWTLVGNFPSTISDATGMAIDSVGNAFVTAGNQLWQIDLVNPMNSVLLGDLGVDESGEPWYSSGDCVLNKSDSLYMSAKRSGIDDRLVLIDQIQATTGLVGDMGDRGVYGLTFAFNSFYGVTSNGDLIEIDPLTGESEILHTFTGRRFFGAASSPQR